MVQHYKELTNAGGMSVFDVRLLPRRTVRQMSQYVVQTFIRNCDLRAIPTHFSVFILLGPSLGLLFIP